MNAYSLRVEKAERERCIKIIRESLDIGEHERSLGQSIVANIRALAKKRRAAYKRVAHRFEVC